MPQFKVYSSCASVKTRDITLRTTDDYRQDYLLQEKAMEYAQAQDRREIGRGQMRKTEPDKDFNQLTSSGSPADRVKW